MNHAEGFKERRVTAPRIDISALIDVVFLLLLFYVVTTTFMERPGIKLELPEAQSAAATRTEDVQVSVSSTGQIYLGDRPTAPDGLFGALKAEFETTESRTVVIRADRSVSHGLVVSVMDAARRAGATGLVVLTREEK